MSGAVGLLDYGALATAHLGSLQMDRRNALRLRYRLDAGAWGKATRVLDIAPGKLLAARRTRLKCRGGSSLGLGRRRSFSHSPWASRSGLNGPPSSAWPW